MKNNRTYQLALFFTRSVSLELWVSSGLLDREKLLYERLLENNIFSKIYWFTYGQDDKLTIELKERALLHKSICTVSMPWYFFGKVGRFLYSIMMPFVHRDILKSVDIYKTNQINGAWSALIAKLLYNKYLMVRMGYLLSLNSKRSNKYKFEHLFYKYVECFSCKYADHTIVTTKAIKEYFTRINNVSVIPNYVDTGIFMPVNNNKYKDRIIFVGRLNRAKNLFTLIDAIHLSEKRLDIYGDGELFNELKEYTRREYSSCDSINFMGVVPNSQLATVYNKYKYFILPSYYEGMPKALIEAMASGLICIGTSVPGIINIIEHKKNGFLSSGNDAQAIAEVIKLATECKTPDLIIKNALMTIQQNFSLNSTVVKEIAIIKNIFHSDDAL